RRLLQLPLLPFPPHVRLHASAVLVDATLELLIHHQLLGEPDEPALPEALRHVGGAMASAALFLFCLWHSRSLRIPFFSLANIDAGEETDREREIERGREGGRGMERVRAESAP